MQDDSHNRLEREITVAMPVTVLVGVRSPAVREALVAMIDDLEGFRVSGQADSAEGVLALARRLSPALAVVDEDLPDCSGSAAIQTLSAERLAGAILAMGLRGDGERRARAAGAAIYVQTGSDPRDLVTALRGAASSLSNSSLIRPSQRPVAPAMLAP